MLLFDINFIVTRSEELKSTKEGQSKKFKLYLYLAIAEKLVLLENLGYALL